MHKDDDQVYTFPVIIALVTSIPVVIIILALGVASVHLFDTYQDTFPPTPSCNTTTQKHFSYANAWINLFFGFIGCIIITYGLVNDINMLEYAMSRVFYIFRFLMTIPSIGILVAWTVMFYRDNCASSYPDLYSAFNSYLICYWVFFGFCLVLTVIGYILMQIALLRSKQK
jgi:hypothetical protein